MPSQYTANSVKIAPSRVLLSFFHENSVLYNRTTMGIKERFKKCQHNTFFKLVGRVSFRNFFGVLEYEHSALDGTVQHQNKNEHEWNNMYNRKAIGNLDINKYI